MAGYWHQAARPAVLAGLLLEAPRDGGHQPTTYEVFVAAAPTERAARVACTCGAAVELAWEPSTMTYAGLLADAWRSHASAGSPES